MNFQGFFSLIVTRCHWMKMDQKNNNKTLNWTMFFVYIENYDGWWWFWQNLYRISNAFQVQINCNSWWFIIKQRKFSTTKVEFIWRSHCWEYTELIKCSSNCRYRSLTVIFYMAIINLIWFDFPFNFHFPLHNNIAEINLTFHSFHTFGYTFFLSETWRILKTTGMTSCTRFV